MKFRRLNESSKMPCLIYLGSNKVRLSECIFYDNLDDALRFLRDYFNEEYEQIKRELWDRYDYPGEKRVFLCKIAFLDSGERFERFTTARYTNEYLEIGKSVFRMK